MDTNSANVKLVGFIVLEFVYITVVPSGND